MMVFAGQFSKYFYDFKEASFKAGKLFKRRNGHNRLLKRHWDVSKFPDGRYSNRFLFMGRQWQCWMKQIRYTERMCSRRVARTANAGAGLSKGYQRHAEHIHMVYGIKPVRYRKYIAQYPSNRNAATAYWILLLNVFLRTRSRFHNNKWYARGRKMLEALDKFRWSSIAFFRTAKTFSAMAALWRYWKPVRLVSDANRGLNKQHFDQLLYDYTNDEFLRRNYMLFVGRMRRKQFVLLKFLRKTAKARHRAGLGHKLFKLLYRRQLEYRNFNPSVDISEHGLTHSGAYYYNYHYRKLYEVTRSN